MISWIGGKLIENIRQYERIQRQVSFQDGMAL